MRPRSSPAFWLALAVAAVAAVAGWRAFWFLTDDAFIAFRYARNHLLGIGLVWNPAPFQPVEGYTSLLWVLILEAVWAITGAAPPETANWLSLGFGLAALAVAARLVWRMALPPELARHRAGLLALVLAGVVANRTFLTWLSSGLETSLFNLCFLAWIACGVAPAAERGRAWLTRLSVAAALAALSRPDGLLLVGASLALLGLRLRETAAAGRAAWREVPWAASLLLVPAHLLWRRAVYGAWVPNTWFAKYVAPWPEAGWRYLGCFALEYGLWVWAALCLAWLVSEGRRRGAGPSPELAFRGVVVAAIAAHAGYYTFAVGGDHFEYRVYSHLVVPIFVSAAWLAVRLSHRPLLVFAALAALVAAELPIPWVHWQETRHLLGRDATSRMARPVAPRFPTFLRPAVRRFDAWQAWLIRHHVGNRHQEHKVFYEHLARTLPSLEQGERIHREERAVLAASSVGLRGWRLPEVAILDTHGLTDRVVARTPPAPGAERLMAHEHTPPAGYVECFRPNLELGPGWLRVRPRTPPLSDADIRACEARTWEGYGTPLGAQGSGPTGQVR